MLYRTIFFFLLTGLCQSATAQQMPDAFLQNLTIMGKAFETNSETTLNEGLRVELHKIVQWIENNPKHISIPAIQAYKMQASILQTNKKLLESEPLLEKAYAMTNDLPAVDSIRLLRVDVLSFLEYACARQNEFSGALHYNQLAVIELKKVADSPNKIGFLFLTCFNRVALCNQMIKPKMMLETLQEIQPYLSYLSQLPPDFQAHYATMKAACDVRYIDSLRIAKMPLAQPSVDSFAQQAIQKLKIITPPSSEAQFFIASYLQQAYTVYGSSERDTMTANLKLLESLAGNNPEKTLFYRIFKAKHYEKWGMTKEFELEVNAAFKNKEKHKIEFPLVYLQLLQLRNQVLEQNADTRPEVLAEHYQEVLDIYTELRENATNSDVLRVWTSYFTDVFKKATDVYCRLYENSKDLKDLNQMLYCAEQTKYFVLGREILQKQWTHKDFYWVESRLNHFKKREKQYPKDKNAIDSVTRYQKQWDLLEKQNHDLFIKTKRTTISQIRSQLMSDKKVGFMEFTKVSNQRLNAIIVTYDTVFTWSSDSLIAIYEAAQIFKDSKWEGHATHKQIRNQLHHLYQLLFADILKSLPQINRLVLVGDEDLMLLPFGAFLVTPANADLEVSDWNYMTKNYAITLLPSVNVYTVLTKTKQSAQSLQFHAYLAQFDIKNNNNTPLDALIAFSKNSKFKNYSITEPDNLCRALSNLKEMDIPIFIAHGLIDTGLQLSNTQRLTLEMLRKQQFYFQFGILAANCNSAQGNQEIGEGIHSYATAFLQAGVPSLLASTIHVRDQYMAKILTYFVEYLEKGLPKDVALQKAQIQFIKTENLAPIFWSHVILLGDFSPL